MKKTLQFCTVLLCALVISTTVKAQTQQGYVMIGSDLSDFNLDFQKHNTAFSMSITPNVAYFVRDNLALGGYINFDLATSSGTTNIGYGVGALGRYYLADKSTQIVKSSRFLLEANVGFAGRNINVDGGEKTSTNGLGIGFGPGWTYFITNTIGLEALLKYNLAVGFGNSTTDNSLALHVGFQIYLPGKRTKNKIMNDMK